IALRARHGSGGCYENLEEVRTLLAFQSDVQDEPGELVPRLRMLGRGKGFPAVVVIRADVAQFWTKHLGTTCYSSPSWARNRLTSFRRSSSLTSPTALFTWSLPADDLRAWCSSARAASFLAPA